MLRTIFVSRRLPAPRLTSAKPLQDSLVLVGLPADRRMALSYVSLAGQAVDGSALRLLPPTARSDLVLLSVLAPWMVSNLSAEISPTLGASDASLGRGAVFATL